MRKRVKKEHNIIKLVIFASYCSTFKRKVVSKDWFINKKCTISCISIFFMFYVSFYIETIFWIDLVPIISHKKKQSRNLHLCFSSTRSNCKKTDDFFFAILLLNNVSKSIRDTNDFFLKYLISSYLYEFQTN